ncbi:hypothetical protein GCM10025868_24290 [Angustibacter aerolatus]|uniref:Uncharacterized protein n=1 Tax=Angustibacter aerolatus TaxID=1162965 RepID=A0ABQ6JH88_9ACTN|nr:hypothetical protein GCM10025868_24290 [Angustibacter aerolatus]
MATAVSPTGLMASRMTSISTGASVTATACVLTTDSTRGFRLARRLVVEDLLRQGVDLLGRGARVGAGELLHGDEGGPGRVVDGALHRAGEVLGHAGLERLGRCVVEVEPAR